MKLAPWTSGPWHVALWGKGPRGDDWPYDRLGVAIGRDGHMSEALLISPRYPHKRLEADARLAAAAPEMAELLRYIDDQGYEPPETTREIRALLSRIGAEA